MSRILFYNFESGGGIVTFEGTLSGIATLSGSLSKISSLIGEIIGTSNLSGPVSILRSFSGNILGVSSFSGGMSVTYSFRGDLNGVGSFNGSLTLLYTLSGEIQGISSLFGSLDVLRGIVVDNIILETTLPTVLQLQGEIPFETILSLHTALFEIVQRIYTTFPIELIETVDTPNTLVLNVPIEKEIVFNLGVAA